MIPTVGALLALSAALAAACFVKAYGIVFLGRPRTPQAESAREVDQFSLAAMLALAALCVIAGVLPGLLIGFLALHVALTLHRHARSGRGKHRGRKIAGSDIFAVGIDRADRRRP